MNSYTRVSDYIIYSGKGITPKYVKNSSIVVLNQKCIRDGKIDYSLSQFTDDSKKVAENKFIMVGDILINSTGVGTAGRCAYVSQLPLGKKVITDSHMLTLRCKTPEESACLYYSLYSFEDKLMTFMTGSSGQSEFDKTILFNTMIKMPSSESQRRILTSKLFAIDKKIELNKRINDMLEETAKNIYDYWFLQFDFPDKNGKPYRSNGGKMIWNEALKREIPENWTTTPLEGYISFDRGISYSTKDIELKSGIPMINLASIDITRNYRPNELKFFSGKFNDDKLVKNGDLLIACTDLTRNADIIGSPIIVPTEYNDYLYSMDLAKVNILSDILTEMYLYMTLRTNFYHNYIKYFASGTNVLHLNLDGILWYQTIIPPKDLQLKFEGIVRKFIKKQSEILNEVSKLKSLRNELIPLFMDGQVGIN
jgi:type I restriction enzyme S subunit